MLITSTNTKVYKLNFNLNTTNHLIQPLPTPTLCTLATCIWCNFISAFVIEWKSTGNCINLKRLKLKKNIGTSRSKEFNISMMPTKSYQCYANPNYRFLTFSSNCCSSGNIPLNYETISDKCPKSSQFMEKYWPSNLIKPKPDHIQDWYGFFCPVFSVLKK